MKNNNLEQRYKEMIEDNVNVGKTNDGVEFLILIVGIVGILFITYLFADSISCFVIDRLPDKTITKIENNIAKMNYISITEDEETQAKLEKLNNIKQRIVAKDKVLQNKPNFVISIVPDKEFNAYIKLDGSITFTEGLLDKINNEETLTFVMAHELGHYANRDCLKHVSRQALAGLVTSILSGGQNNTNIAVNGISDLNALTYSRAQEKQADEYANKMLYKLYGRNTGAVEFFKYLEKEEKAPEFLQYFSTHPSTHQRLIFITKNK